MRQLLRLALVLTLTGWAQAQNALPGKPEDNGVIPLGDTIYVNTLDTINNSKTESLGVGIARNGNVLVGWEDDGSDLTDLEAVWTLFTREGTQLTPDTEITSLNPSYAGQKLTSKFLSYFRSNGIAISGRTSWGPKIKANLFGDGIGMGATSFELGIELTQFADIQMDAGGGGDFPSVQLLDNNGGAIGVLSGLSDADAEPAGDVRIGDWDFLSTGNVVIVGESRQRDDLVTRYKGAEAQTHAVVRILDRTGKEIKATQLVSETPTKSEIWHGVGVTKNGFAVRFAGANGRATVRLFDNAGSATSTNIDLATVAGSEIAAGGGRGDSVGFHGNGNDAYVVANVGNDAEGKRRVFVTVLNANGTLRWAKVVSDDLNLVGGSRVDAAIDSLGRVAVAFDDQAGTGGAARLVMARVFAADGKPLGKTFHVSELELPSDATLEARNPRVAFRNDTVAIVWETLNAPGTEARVVALRSFVLPIKPGSIESVGLTRIVPDTAVINQSLPALGNWEPYSSVLGTSTFLIEGNAFADGTTDMQRYVVALQPAAGGAMKLGEGFFADNGQPFKGPINASRQNGNPGRVAGDTRPGAVNFMVGAEASPHVYPEFQSNNRWNLGFDRLVDGRYGTVQTFKLDPATLTQTPLSKAQDSALGRLTTGDSGGNNQISRFGGDIVALENGNFVSVVEDRSRQFNPNGNGAVATIFAPDGTVVKDSFLVANGDLWSNVAAYKGGFAVRVAGVLYFFDNQGAAQGSVDQNTSGESFDRGRGDGTRIAGHINSHYIYLAGKVSTATVVRVTAWDTRTRTFFAVTDVSEGGFTGGFDRATVAVDALNRIVVSWVSQPPGYEMQQVAARVLALDEAGKAFKPLTGSFLAFINAAPTGNIRSLQMSLALTTKQIMIAAKGEINLQNKPDQGANSEREINFYTVISHPAPAEDPTPAVGGGGGGGAAQVAVTRNGNNAVLSWTGGRAPFTVQKRADVASGTWAALTTTNDRTLSVPIEGATMFFRVVGQ